MNLELNEDQAFFRETTHRFIAAESPIATVRSLHHDDHGFVPEWWRQAAELGWTAMLVAEKHGGGSLSGNPLADAVLVAEEIGRGLAPGPFQPVNVVAAALAAADAPQHAEVLGQLVGGESIATWAFGERGNVWDPDDLSTTATVDSDHIVIDGVKAYVEAAQCADHLLVTARTDGVLTQILVPADTDGLRIIASNSIDLGRRFAEVHFSKVRLPLSAVVGEVGGAAGSVARQLRIALVLQCADIVGGLDRVFEFTLEYMGDRYAFGRPISSYQALKHRVADLLLQLETAKGCVDAAVTAFDTDSADADVEASVAKAYVADKAMHLIQECMQFHGGMSVTWEHDLHLYLRRASVNRALYGTPEQHHERICRLLGF